MVQELGRMSALLLIGLASCAGGQSGDNPGGRQCGDDVTCETSVTTGIEGLDRPKANPPVYELAHCRRVDLPESDAFPIGLYHGDDVACTCSTVDGRGFWLYAKDQCFVRSRGRECLYTGDEFPGCDPNVDDNDVCAAVCAELTTRVAHDSERTFDASVRSSRCLGGSGRCAIVVEIDGRCYLSASTEQHDCSLSDEAIIAAQIAKFGSLDADGLGPRY
jgi:hypothetical protein